MKKKDIGNLEDIKLLVNTFYDAVRKDDLIGGIFHGVIKDWNIHLEKMYRFWQTILLDEHSYSGSPFPPHASMSINQLHFDRWLLLWSHTVDDLFLGKVAEEAKWRGDKMAAMFLSKIQYLRDRNFKSMI